MGKRAKADAGPGPGPGSKRDGRLLDRVTGLVGVLFAVSLLVERVAG